MKALKSKKVRNAVDVADELEVVRLAIKERKVIERTLTTELIAALHAEKRDEAGNYHLSTAKTLKVADETLAWSWVEKYPACKKIDTAKAKQVFERGFEDPTKFGFEIKVSERVVPKGGSDEENN